MESLLFVPLLNGELEKSSKILTDRIVIRSCKCWSLWRERQIFTKIKWISGNTGIPVVKSDTSTTTIVTNEESNHSVKECRISDEYPNIMNRKNGNVALNGGARGFTTIRDLAKLQESGIVPLDCLHVMKTADSRVLDLSDLLFVMQICLRTASTIVSSTGISYALNDHDVVVANRLSHVPYLELKFENRGWHDRTLKNEKDFRTHDSKHFHPGVRDNYVTRIIMKEKIWS